MNASRFPATRAFALLDTDAVRHNFYLLRAQARRTNPNAHVIAVVKANAYGHGVDAVIPTLCAAGCDFFAVATEAEAMAVRALAPDAHILILGYTPPARAKNLAENRLIQTVFSAEYAAALAAAADAAKCRPTVHLKLDCGMCRLGFSPKDTKALLRICRQGKLRITGLYTHFPNADGDPAETRIALQRFLACRSTLAKAGFPLFAHAAASAALLTLPESVLDAVRPGIALYGLPPVQTNLALRPALSLCAPVVQLRRVPAGTPVGYGGDFVTPAPALIATLPIGYADGFARALTGCRVRLHHQKKQFSVPVAGRVSMDQLTLDVTSTPAAVGDTVFLWENAAAPAEHLGTIPYEILTSVSPRVERIPLPDAPRARI